MCTNFRELDLESYSKKLPVGVSNRHLHITQADLEVLFGEGATLTPKKNLIQPGQYACEEQVTIKGPKGELENVRILGPVRPETQIELSQTDARKIGVKAQLRESGKLEGTAGCTLIGPKGEIKLDKGCVVALLHVHLHTDEAKAWGVEDKQMLTVGVKGQKTVIFNDVLARVGDNMKLEFHLDTDEANAALLGNDGLAVIID